MEQLRFQQVELFPSNEINVELKGKTWLALGKLNFLSQDFFRHFISKQDEIEIGLDIIELLKVFIPSTTKEVSLSVRAR